MEAIPSDLIEFAGIALELDSVKNGGGNFSYPDSLTPLEWDCVSALTRGRDRAESMKQERERKDRRLAEAKARLNK